MRPWTGSATRLGALAATIAATVAAAGVTGWTTIGEPPAQPVAFSHAHHAGALGLDCRFCHGFVEVGPVAGMPPMETCMGCHYPVEPRPMVAPLEWRRVVRLPRHTYFDHSAHFAAGIACATCHGRIEAMERTRQEQPFTMLWCLDCHRDARQARRRGLTVDRLTHCHVCHR